MNHEQSDREREPNIVIASGTPDDVEGIQDLLQTTWLATYPNKELGITEEMIVERFAHRHEPEEITKRKERMKNLPEGELVFVAKDGEKVVGFVRTLLDAQKNTLQALYVLPEHHGQGIGKLLWQKVCEYIDRQNDTIVHVATYNTKAISFYNGLGFQDTGKRMHDPRLTFSNGKTIPEMEMVIKGSKE